MDRRDRGRRRPAAEEHAFGVAGGEGAAGGRASCLVEHRCALWRGLRQVVSLHVEVPPVVGDPVDAGGVGETPSCRSAITAPSSQLPSQSWYMIAMYSSAIS